MADGAGRQIREPIRFRGFWVGLFAILLAGVPWYLPTGSLEPTWLGVPYWVWISVVLSLVFCGYIRWACLRLWNIVEDDERAAADRER